MTPQNSTFIDFQEIPAIDITCKHCKSVIRLALPKVDIAKSVFCVGCNTQLWFDENQDYVNILGILRTLSRYKERASEMKFSVGFSFTSVSGPFSGAKA